MSNPQLGTLGPMYARSNPAGPTFGGPQGAIVFPATVNVADPAGLTDLFGAMLSVDATGALRVRVSSVNAATVFPVSPAILANSLGARGTVATPGAGAVIATIAAPPAGTYDVQVQAYLTVAGTANNMEFRRGATVVSALNVLAGAATAQPPVFIFRCVLDGVTAISVNATAADAAGTYQAELIATRIA